MIANSINSVPSVANVPGALLIITLSIICCIRSGLAKPKSCTNREDKRTSLSTILYFLSDGKNHLRLKLSSGVWSVFVNSSSCTLSSSENKSSVSISAIPLLGTAI